MKKKIISLLLAFSILVSVFAVLPAMSATAATPGAENLSSYDYVISTKDELRAFATAVNTGAKITANSGANSEKEIDAFSAKAVLKNDIAFNEGYSFEINFDTSLVKIANGENVYYLGTGLKGEGGGNNQFDSTASENNKWYTLGADGKYTTDGASDPTALAEGALEVWAPIGNSANLFLGSFNGNGYTVSGLYVNNTDYAGLFGYAGAKYIQGEANYDGETVVSYNGATYAASIKGVTVKDSFMKSTKSVGAVVGCLQGNVNGFTTNSVAAAHDHALHPQCKIGTSSASIVFSDNKNVNTDIVGASNVGGVAGHILWDNHFNVSSATATAATNSYSQVPVSHLSNSGDVLASGEYAAGIVGYGQRMIFKDKTSVFRNDGKIRTVISTSSCDFTAGIVARMNDGGFEGYFINTGDVSGKNHVAGIVAYAARTVKYALNTGNVTGQGYVGGIAGKIVDNNVGIEACANLGNVTADNNCVGGLVGQAATGSNGFYIIASYNMGQVVSKYQGGNERALVGGFASNFKSIDGAYSIEIKAKDGTTVPLFADALVTAAGDTKIKNAEIITDAAKFTDGTVFELLNKTGAYFEQPVYGAPLPKIDGGAKAIALEGEGTKESPYLIYNAEDLAEFRNRVNAKTYKISLDEYIHDMDYAHARLMADIALNPGYKFEFSGDTSKYTVKVTDPEGDVAYVARGTIWYADAEGTNTILPEGFTKPTSWTPIGTSAANAYKGTFDGNGHTISGLFIATTATSQGLFGYVGSDAKSELAIKDLTVADSCVVAGSNTGTLVGQVITNVGDTSTTSARCDHSDGVCDRGYDVVDPGKEPPSAYSDADGHKYADFEDKANNNRIRGLSITGCTVENSVVAGNGNNIGGLIGNNARQLHLWKNDAAGTVFGYYQNRSYAGILLHNCTNDNTTVIGNQTVGGIAGAFNFGSLQYLVNKGDVYGTADKVAGLIAYIDNHSSNNKYNANYGNVTGAASVGGCYVASNRALSYLYNAGNVTANYGNAGGIIAAPGDCSSISYSANVGTITNNNNETGYVGGIIGQISKTNMTLTGCYNAGTLVGGFERADFAVMANNTLKLTLNNCYDSTDYVSAVLINKADANVVGESVKVSEAEVKDGTLLSKLGTAYYGQSVNMDYPIPAYKASLAGSDVTLKGGILLNFYVDASTTVDMGDAELVTVDGKQYYKITVEVDAKAMGDNQTVTVAGVNLTQSVVDYAAGILAGDYTEQTKALVAAMLNYGAAAQNYFDYKTYSLVGTPVTDTAALAGAEVADSTVTNPTGKYIGASLILEGTMKLRFYFKGNDVEATVDGKAAEVVNGKNYCYVDVEVTPDRINNFFEVAAGDVTVEYSALNYLKNTVSNPEKADLHEMVASIYAYSVEAENFVATPSAPLTPLEELQREDISVYEYPMDSINPVHGTIGYSAAAPGTYVANFTDGDGIDYHAVFIEITDTTFDSVSFKVSQSSKDHDDPWICYAFLTDLPTHDERAPFANGYSMCRNSTKDITVDIPEDARYIYFYYDYDDCVYMPDSIVFTKGKTTLENIQDETLTEYSYPMDHIAADMAVIEYYGNKSHKYKVDGKCFITIIDITDCAFDYVSFGEATSGTDWVIWTFLTEYPTYGAKVSYASGYDTLEEIQGAVSNVEIPDDAKYLVVYHSEDYKRFYYPQSIVFHDTKK